MSVHRYVCLYRYVRTYSCVCVCVYKPNLTSTFHNLTNSPLISPRIAANTMPPTALSPGH